MIDFIADVVSEYPALEIQRIEPLNKNRGLSGAELWKLHTETGNLQSEFCLRCWPVGHPNYSQLALIHRVIANSFVAGCRFLAVPIANRQGQTITRVLNRDFPSGSNAALGQGENRGETLWEVAPWMPGRADFCHNPNSTRLKNMMQALASFHLASAQIALDFHTSQNLQRRYAKLIEFLEPSKSSVLERADLPAATRLNSELVQEIRELKELVVGAGPMLARKLLSSGFPSDFQASGARSLLPSMILPVQPILRDIWHDHVLFSDDTVTGIIDYGAMQVDNVAFDIARLLGTTVAEDQDLWNQGVADYCELRKLSEMELKLLPWINRSGVLLGSCHWLNWLLIEKRTFQDWELVKQRVLFHKQQLQRLSN